MKMETTARTGIAGTAHQVLPWSCWLAFLFELDGGKPGRIDITCGRYSVPLWFKEICRGYSDFTSRQVWQGYFHRLERICGQEH
jgi:hypothetical protein